MKKNCNVSALVQIMQAYSGEIDFRVEVTMLYDGEMIP